jgi:tetratricopeptide (TPR) repeat protein
MRTVRAAFRGLVGPDHPLTLVSASNHVALLRSLDVAEEALRIGRDTADRLLALLGERHPYTLAAQMNLAVCLADTGRLEEARKLEESSVRLLTGLLSSGHPDALRAAANLALTRRALGEQGAEEVLTEILSRLEESIGREHPSAVALRSGTRTHRLLDPQPF